MSYIYHAFSFGAGVQSTTLMLLIKHNPQLLLDTVGHLPDKAYFADTGAEPDNVYQHLERIRSIFPIPLEIVNNGSLLGVELQNGIQPRTFPPYYTRNPDGTKGMLLRKCTSEFKIVPIEKAIRRDLAMKSGTKGRSRSVALWLGISVDEAQRMRDNNTKLMQNTYPLVELGWNRSKCYSYCQEHGITPPKSRCFFCPYISDWVDIRRSQPKEFEKAVQFDKEIRNVVKGGVRGEVFIHKSCKPLGESIPKQGHLWEKSPWEEDFAEECSGHCGV